MKQPVAALLCIRKNQDQKYNACRQVSDQADSQNLADEFLPHDDDSRATLVPVNRGRNCDLELLEDRHGTIRRARIFAK